MANIRCSGCGGLHPRPGRTRCRRLKGNILELDNESEVDSDDEVPANPNSMVAWSSILSSEEAELPDRTDPSYMDLCERTITDLTKQLESSTQYQRVEKAESQIASLMSKLKIDNPVSTGSIGRGAGARDKNRTPPRGRGDT